MRFRYFDPMQQSTVQGEVGAGCEVGELVRLVCELRHDCSPALELTASDGSSLVLGIDGDRAVLLWTSADGKSRHSVGATHGERFTFDYFGAFTQVPGHYAVALTTAVDAARGYVDGYPGVGVAPKILMATD